MERTAMRGTTSVPSRSDHDEGSSASGLIAELWTTLTSFIGSAATAALLRRSQKVVATRLPEIAALRIERHGLEYRCVAPEAWNDEVDGPVALVRELARELGPILFELTGGVVIARLTANPVLRMHNILFPRSRDR